MKYTGPIRQIIPPLNPFATKGPVRFAIMGAGSSDPVFLLPANLLMTGNSLTRGDPDFIPIISIIDALCDQDALGDVDEDMFTEGGYTFQSHYNDPDWQTKNQSEVWTHHSLQPGSLENAAANYANFITYGKLLADLALTENPNARLLLYVTSPYNQTNSVGGNPNIYPGTFANPKAMRDANVTGHNNLRNEIMIDHPTAYPPVIADVCSLVYGLGGSLLSTHASYRSLQNIDGLHWNNNGVFLAGCLFYYLITGRNPATYAVGAAAALGVTLTFPAVDLATFAYRWGSAQALPVLITLHPTDETVDDGDPVTFTGEVEGTGTISIQWYKDGVLLVGETTDTLNIASVSGADDGAEYYFIATNSEGPVESTHAVLTVDTVPIGPELRLDFSNTASAQTTDLGWTTVNSDAAGGITALKDQTGAASGCNFVVTTWTVANFSSQGNPSGAGYTPPVPNNASVDFWFGSDATNLTIQAYIDNLPPGAEYTCYCIPCRSGIPGTENRHTKLTVTGTGSTNAELNAAANLTNTMVLTGTVDGTGRLYFRWEAGPSNTNASHFFYTNTLILLNTP